MAAQLNWLDGFLSASVWFRQSNIAEGTDANGIYGWIDGYCTSHPLDQISDAAVSLLGELSKRQTAQ
jgi:hypothetical protein